MKPYTKSDYNRVKVNNMAYTRSINEALRILENEKKSKVKKDEDDLSEDELFELFGWGKKSVDKPAKAISLQNTDDENAQLVIDWCKFYMAEANNNVDAALTKLFESAGDALKKAPKLFVKALVILLTAPIKGGKYAITEVSNVTLSCIFGTIRLVNSGVEGSKEALQQLYKTLQNGLNQFYTALSKNVASFVQGSKDKLTTWMGALTAAMTALASKAMGIAEAMGDLFKQILAEAKKKSEAGILIAKTWLQSKNEAVLKWIRETAGDIRSDVVEAWNKMEKKVRSAYNDAVKQLEEWMKDLKDLAKAAGAKIQASVEKGVEKSKDFVIDKKDKALVWSIQKAVKGLSDKYTEDQIVALVRKCYVNEGLKPMFNGNYRINEQYFYDSRTRRRMRNRRLNS